MHDFSLKNLADDKCFLFADAEQRTFKIQTSGPEKHAEKKVIVFSTRHSKVLHPCIGSKKKFRPLTRSRRKDGYFLRKITGSERKETCYKKRMLDHVDAWPNQEEIPSIKIIFIAKTLSVITE